MCPGTPVLFSSSASSADVVQGALGDCWFLSALAVVAAREPLLRSLFVETGQESQGRYCLQFFKAGDWVLVYVDDRVPCDAAGKPLYCRSTDPNELWPILIEKAYAKLHGSYESLVAGFADYALGDMTGGVPGRLTVAGESDGLWAELLQQFRMGLLGAAHSVKGSEAVETALDGGILAVGSPHFPRKQAPRV
jgi:calpain-15